LKGKTNVETLSTNRAHCNNDINFSILLVLLYFIMSYPNIAAMLQQLTPVHGLALLPPALFPLFWDNLVHICEWGEQHM
jgi:hypothetical protein